MSTPMSKLWLRRAVKLASYLCLYVVADGAALAHGDVAPWNAAAALSFGLVARLGPGWSWAALAAPVLAGALGGELWSGPGAVSVRAVAEAAACAGAALVLRPHGVERPDLGRLRTIFLLFVTTIAAAALIGAARAAVAGLDLWPAVELAGRLILAHMVAILTVAPLVVIRGLPRAWGPVRLTPSIEALLQVAALAILAWEVFGRFVNQEIHFFYLLFLPLAWIATRHGQPGAATALGALFAAPLASDWLFGHHDPAVIELQIRLGVLAMTSLLLGAMVSERRLSESRMLARQTELAHFQRLNVGWEMASALAHELNQPLTAAMNYTQAAQRLIAAPSPDLARAGAVMAKSVDQIERVGQTIHGLRDFMRKGELRLAANDLREMVEDALRLVSAEANAAGIGLHAVGLGALPPVMVDKTQIVQVLVNLARNAVQALAATGRGDNPTVLVSGRAVDGVVEVTVTDNGPGLAPQVLARLFEPFVTTKPAGMGLGLSISKSIVEAHDSRLWAENAAHGGATFHFTLPLAVVDA
ncbi:MAG: MASE1 domain-containing protein [Magnetospirillum sp.]|nr:MASE1 domain-containing protein [Magnetospirillum sp.]